MQGPAFVGLGNGAPPARTQSGLVKRNARDGAGSTVGADRPSGDLLDSLSRHATNLQGGVAPPPFAPPARTGAGPDGRWGAPPAPPGNGGPHAEPLARRRPAPGGPAGPPPTAPPPVMRPARAMPAAAPPPTPAPAIGDGGSTSGGLTRRVRGAQMPATQPLSLRRSGPDDRPAGGPPPARPPAAGRPAAAPTPSPGLRRGPGPQPAPPRPPAMPSSSPDLFGSPESQRRADDVYSFLSSFTAGVRRGLEANSGDEPDPERDDRR